MANKDLDIKACKIFVCPNIGLIEERCKEHNVPIKIINTTKDLAVEYFKNTYHQPRYGNVKVLFPAFLYIALNMKVIGGNRALDIRGGPQFISWVLIPELFRQEFTTCSQDLCCVIFGLSASSTTRKWIKEILKDLKIDYYASDSSLTKYYKY